MRYVYSPLINNLFILSIFPTQFHELALLGICEVWGQSSVLFDGKQDQHTSKSSAVCHVKEVGKWQRNDHWPRWHIKTRSNSSHAYKHFTNEHVRIFSTLLVIFKILNKTSAPYCVINIDNHNKKILNFKNQGIQYQKFCYETIFLCISSGI